MSIKFKQTEVIVTWKDKPLPELNELELREALNWAIAEMQRLQKLVPIARQQGPRLGMFNAGPPVMGNQE